MARKRTIDIPEPELTDEQWGEGKRGQGREKGTFYFSAFLGLPRSKKK